jgi:hypothetical protein
MTGVVGEWEQWWSRRAAAAAEAGQPLVATTAQLVRRGVSRKVTRGRVARGRWVVPLRGTVAAVSADDLAADGREVAARREHALSCIAATLLNPGHVIGARSAAVVRGLPTLNVPPRPELYVPAHHPSRRAGACRSVFDDVDQQLWLGVPITGVARMVVDAARRDRRDGLVVADAVLREWLCTPAEIGAAIRAAARRPGIATARTVLALADARSESALESLARLAIVDEGLPLPELQVEIAVPALRRTYRVDMFWRAQRLVVELDGRAKDNADELWREKRREDALRELGLRFLRLTWRDVQHDWPATAARLRRSLELH